MGTKGKAMHPGEQILINSVIDSVKGQSVFGENFSSNFDVNQGNMHPEVINNNTQNYS